LDFSQFSLEFEIFSYKLQSIYMNVVFPLPHASDGGYLLSALYKNVSYVMVKRGPCLSCKSRITAMLGSSLAVYHCSLMLQYIPIYCEFTFSYTLICIIWLWAGRLRGRSSSPCRVKNFLQIVQTSSGVYPTSYPIGTGDSFPGVKRPRPEADHTSTPLYAFMV
jgi:hypothetical protein